MDDQRTAAPPRGNDQYTAGQLRALTAPLAIARRERCIPKSALSRRLELNENAVSQWERSTAAPTIRNLIRWADRLGFALSVYGPDREAITTRPQPAENEPPERYEARRITHALASAREDAGFLQTALARELEVSDWYMHMWERGYRLPRVPQLIAWADRLGCELKITEC